MKINIVKSSNITDGLFSYLYCHKKYPTNYVNKIVKASASSVYANRSDPYVTINPCIQKTELGDYWISENIPNSSFSISFINHLFALDSYTIQSRDFADYNIPLEWILEGSNDNLNWETIHFKERGNEINGEKKTFNWSCESKTSIYSYFKFTQIGENQHHSDDQKYMFAIGSIELFGTLFEKFLTFRYKSFNLQNYFLFLLTFIMF